VVRELFKYNIFVDFSKVIRVNYPFHIVQSIVETYDNVKLGARAFSCISLLAGWFSFLLRVCRFKVFCTRQLHQRRRNQFVF